MCDDTLPNIYTNLYFMKKNANFNIQEMELLAPHEFKLFYNMAVRDFKERVMEEQRIKQKLEGSKK